MFDQLWRTATGDRAEAPAAGGILNSGYNHYSGGLKVSLDEDAPAGHDYSGAGAYDAGAGDENARPIGAQPIASELPGALKGAKAADQVRAIAQRKAGETWDKLDEEVRVQKLVWESLALTKKGLQPDISAAQVPLDEAVAARQAGDQYRALDLLQQISASGEGGILSKSMLQCAQSILQVDDDWNRRERLAERLDTAGVPASLPRTAADKAELEELLMACDLGDKRLERSIRQALLLPFTAKVADDGAHGGSGLGAAAGARSSGRSGGSTGGTFAPVTYVASRKLSEIVGGKRSDAPPAATAAKATGSRGPGSAARGSGRAGGSGGTSDGFVAPVHLTGSRNLFEIAGSIRSSDYGSGSAGAYKAIKGAPARTTLSNRGNSLGAVAAATESVRSSASAQQPGSAATAVRRLAAEGPGKAWERLQQELDVQKMVWESVGLLKVKPGEKSAFEAETASAAQRVWEVLGLRAQDPERALAALEALLASPPKDSEGKDVLNIATRSAAQDVINHHEAAPLRMQLAERLDVASVPATLPRGDAQKAEVDQLVVRCCLADRNLERVVRQMLLLPIPAALGPPLTEEKLSSKYSTVSGRRSNSTGAVTKASKKDSRPVAARPSAPSGPAAPPNPGSHMGPVAAPRGVPQQTLLGGGMEFSLPDRDRLRESI